MQSRWIWLAGLVFLGGLFLTTKSMLTTDDESEKGMAKESWR